MVVVGDDIVAYFEDPYAAAGFAAFLTDTCVEEFWKAIREAARQAKGQADLWKVVAANGREACVIEVPPELGELVVQYFDSLQPLPELDGQDEDSTLGR